MQRRILSTALKKWGYTILEADCGEAALEICRSQRIPMIISDWIMPGLSGPEFCKKFRGLDPSDYGYFLLLTSKNTSDEIAEGLNSGADDFLTKPVNFGELRARLTAGERILDMQAELTRKNAQINAALNKTQRLYADLERDLKEARNLQQSLIPQMDAECAEGRTSMMLRPCGHVGGDLVGKFRIHEDEFAFFSLDVSGHGVSSALMTARLAASLNAQTPEQNICMTSAPDGSFIAKDPAQAAADLNRMLLREIETEHYFTLALAIVNLRTGHTRAVQAGHPHPMIFNPKSGVRKIGTGGMPIGLLPDAEFQSFEFNLRQGDRLFLYSDGITECANPAGDLLDEPGLEDMLDDLKDRDGPELLADLLFRLTEFSEGEEFDDDVSALVFEYRVPDSTQA